MSPAEAGRYGVTTAKQDTTVLRLLEPDNYVC